MYLSRLSRAFVCAVLLSAASAVVCAQEQTRAGQGKVEVKLVGAPGKEKLKAHVSQ